jgi:hypothetical protein
MDGNSALTAGDDGDTREGVGSVLGTRNQEDSIASATRGGAAFGADVAVTVEPDLIGVFEQCPFPPERGGGTDRAPEFHVVSCAEEEQFWAPFSGVMLERHRPDARATEVIERHGGGSGDVETIDSTRNHWHVDAIGGEGRELMRQPATFVSDEYGKIPAGLKSINFCRAGEVVARDKTWVQRPQLTGGSG